MMEYYEKLPYIGKKRAKKLKEAGIGIEEIAQMDENELKRYIPRISRGKLKIMIATARKYVGAMNDIADKLGLEKDKAIALAFNNYDVEKIARAKKEEIAKILNVDENEAFNIIFRASLSVGVRKPEVKIKREEVNHTGIVSKEGFVNGFGAPPEFKVERKVKILPVIIVILLLVSGIAAVVFLSTPEFKIDGNFSEWSHVPSYKLGDLTYKYEYHAGSLYFFLTQNSMFYSEESIYVLMGNSTPPGYYVDGIYVKRVVEFYGWNSTLKGAHIWRYVSSTFNWNFTGTSGLKYAYRNGGIEFLVNEVNPNSKFVVLFKNGNVLRSSPMPVEEHAAQVIVENEKSVANNNTPVLKINITAPRKFTLNTVSVEYQGANITGAYIDLDGNKINGILGNGTVVFTVDKEIESTDIQFAANYSGRKCSVIHLNVSLYSVDMKFSYKRLNTPLYLFKAPKDVCIDGAFGDWKGRISYDGTGNVKDANIDIVAHAHTRFFRSVYMSVRGEFMGGDDVPIVRKWSPVDSDRDSVPDKYDKYPHDFNNDGIPDKDSYVEINGTKLPDVDGDGIPDYPYGPDMWLNTTIPKDFPKPYAGRNVTVYIGPAPPIKPKDGNDTAEIYFGDDNPKGAHLYWVPFPVDYKIKITGRDGIFHSHLYKYDNENWKFIKNITSVAAGYHEMEMATGLNISHGKMWITVFNWNHEYDSISMHSRATRATTTNVFYLHADTNGNPGNMNWTKGSNKNTLKLKTPFLGGKVNGKWYYEYILNQDYYINSAQVSFYINDISITNGGNDYLNITLVDSSGKQNATVGYTNVTGNTLENYKGEKYNINLNILRNYINKGDHMLLIFTWISDLAGGGDEVDIDYNDTSPYDSNLAIETNSTMQVRSVWTENYNTHSVQGHFSKGDYIDIYANVTDPLGYEHIKSAKVSCEDALGNVYLSDSSMSVTYEKDGYKIFHFSFQLISTTYVYTGRYPITVTAEDKEGFSAQGTGRFWVNDNFRVPISKMVFAPKGITYSAQFRHRWDNLGDGDTILDIKLDKNPGYDVLFYLDNKTQNPSTYGNKVIDKNDTLIAIYDSSTGSWKYMMNDTDGDGNPDVTVMYQSKVRIIAEMNVTLSSSHPKQYLNVTYFVFTGNFSTELNDVAIVRDVNIKTLYLRQQGNSLYLYPQEGTKDETVIGADPNHPKTWTLNPKMANDLTIMTMNVIIYVNKKGAKTGYLKITLGDGTLIGKSTFNLQDGINAVTITPQISLIPQNSIINLTFYGDKACDVNFNSSNYESDIIIETTSYIYTYNAETYNGTTYNSHSANTVQKHFNASDIVHITTTVRDPFGGYDIQEVSAQITFPNGTVDYVDLSLEVYHNSYQIYGVNYSIPNDAPVGNYTIKIRAMESNSVVNYTSTYFLLNCNISISPSQNSSYGTVVWYNHTIWNNGSGRDIVSVNVESNQTANITLFVYNTTSEKWDLVAYSNTGTGWDWVNGSYDVNNDKVPDFKIDRERNVKIAVRVRDTGSVKGKVQTTVRIDDSILSSCSDSAKDITTVPELNAWPFVSVLLIIAVVVARRRSEKHK